MWGRILFILVSLLLASAAAAALANSTQEAKLEQLRSAISELQGQLKKRYRKQDRLQYQLRENELKISSLGQQRRQLKIQLQQQRQRLKILEREEQEHNDYLTDHRHTLQQLLRLAYENRFDSRLALALSAVDPIAPGRQFAYLDYLNLARKAKMETLVSKLEELAQNQIALQQQRTTIGQQQREIESNQLALRQQQGEKRESLQKIASRIHTDKDQLTQMQADEAELATLIKQIRALDTAALVPAKGFSRQRGRLTWPVDGKVVVRYGSRRANSRQRWSGIVIHGAAESEVSTVFDGRVVFADWLRGFGLLLIIDHGEDYLSLYGYNQSLHKTVGDRVEAGEVVATTSTDEKGAGQLYFEIRRKGKPQNPEQWCRG